MRRASCDLPAPVGPISRIGACERDRDVLDPLDQRVEGGVARLDAATSGTTRSRAARRAKREAMRSYCERSRSMML